MLLNLNETIEGLSALTIEIGLSIGSVVLLGFRAFFQNKVSALYYMCLACLAIAFGFSMLSEIEHASYLFHQSLYIDERTHLYQQIIDALSIICLLFFWHDKSLQRSQISDLLSIYPIIIVGLHMMLMANNWLMVVLSIEIVSVGSYLIVAYTKHEKSSSEAGLKYVLFGLVITAILLYGISVLYALEGDITWGKIPENSNRILSLLSLVFVVVGIGFKMGIVPLHFWMPDVFQGASVAAVTFLSTLPKVASTLLLFRFWENFGSTYQELYWIVSIFAIFTLLLGNLVAMWQNQVKKLLAYSSIGHTGLLLMSISTAQWQLQDAYQSTTFYLCVYILATLLLFLVLLSHPNKESLSDFSGYGTSQPWLASAVVVACISLIGLPPTAGFWGKFYLFSNAWQGFQSSHEVVMLLLLALAVLCTLFSLFYYFRWIRNFFFGTNENHRDFSTQKLSQILQISLAVLLLLMGIFPSLLLDLL